MLTWAQARPMLFALRALSRMKDTSGATLQFDGGYTGTVQDGCLILRDGPTGDGLEGVVWKQPASWPISHSRKGEPDPNQLTLDDAIEAL